MSNQKLNLIITNLLCKNAVLRILFIFSCVLFSVASCKHDPNIPLIVKLPGDPIDQPTGGTGECDPDSIYFEKDVLPLLTTYCVSGCHDEATANAGVVLSSYSRIMATADVREGNPDASDLYEVLVETDINKRMPLSPLEALSAENIEIIRKWIEQGALNNTCNFDMVPIDTTTNPVDTNDTSGCNPSDVSFSNDVTPVFSSYGCIGCHSGGSVILNTYAGTKQVADNGRLFGAINHSVGFQAMPQGGAKMDSCDIKVIENWINEGTLDN
jgi:hypothetical protein